MKPQIKPTAMPCTEEQWLNEMKPLCDKHGLEYEQLDGFLKFKLLVNNLWGQGIISNVTTKDVGLKDYQQIPYHPELFMYNSGIFPEKWAVKRSKEFADFFNKNRSKNEWTDDVRFIIHHSDDTNYMYYSIDKDGDLDINKSIPTDYVEVTLEELMFHYEPKTTKHTWINMGDTTEQPKWEDRTTHGEEIESIIEFCDHFIVKLQLLIVPQVYNKKGVGPASIGNLIPRNPLKAKLLAEKEGLKKRLEEIEKQLK